MVSKRSWKAWVVLGVAVAVFVTSGGFLMASNMGFKINKGLSRGNVGNTNIGVNWISLPYNNPFVTFRGLCAAFVAQNAFVFPTPGPGAVNVEQILISEPPFASGTARNVTCLSCCLTAACVSGAGGNCDQPLVQDASGGGIHGVRVRITGTTSPNSPTNIVMVGSSAETQNSAGLFAPTFTNTNINHNWISVPYHTTWLKANDVCVTLGATLTNSAVAIGRIDPAGVTTTFNCGASATLTANFGIVIGEGVRVLKTNTTFPPPLPAAGMAIPHF
jgi:hypothetical protein